MQFGYNTNLKQGQTVYHVQTEDRGLGTALIDTTVFCKGRVLHRRTNNYFDLLPLDADRESVLKLRIEEQHRSVLDEIRTGALGLAEPPAADSPSPAANPATVAKTPESAAPVSSGTRPLLVELINAKSWLTGKHALLQVGVRDKESGKAVGGARVVARIEGAATPAEFSAETGPYGQAQIEFEMPKLVGPEVALVIDAAHGDAKGHIRFQLKSKPKAPVA